MKYIVTAFVLGIIFGVLALSILSSQVEKPFRLFSENISKPGDDIKEEDIIITDDEIILKIKDCSISRYADTGSMLPVLDENSNGIRIPVYSEKDINLGDIVTFKTKEGLIVHRVIEIGEDSEGWYIMTKGDNNSISDGKIRFNQIKYKTIGVLW